MICERRILSVLRDNPKGLNVRELKRKTSERCVRDWLEDLRKDGYIDYPEVKPHSGKKKIVKITEKGRNHCKLLMDIYELEKEIGVVSSSVELLPFEKKLDLYEKLLMDIFETCLKADPKFAVRFLNITLFVVRKVLDKKRYDIEIEISILKAIQKDLLGVPDRV